MASRSCPSKAVLSGRSITPRGGLCVSHNGNNAAEPVIAVTDLSFPTAAAAAAASCSESGAQRLKENVLEKGISFFSFFFFACTDEMRPSYQAPMLDQMIKFMISRDNRMLGAGKFKQNTKFLFSLASPPPPEVLPTQTWAVLLDVSGLRGSWKRLGFPEKPVVCGDGEKRRGSLLRKVSSDESWRFSYTFSAVDPFVCNLYHIKSFYEHNLFFFCTELAARISRDFLTGFISSFFIFYSHPTPLAVPSTLFWIILLIMFQHGC